MKLFHTWAEEISVTVKTFSWLLNIFRVSLTFFLMITAGKKDEFPGVAMPDLRFLIVR
jgi:hypothetical protein